MAAKGFKDSKRDGQGFAAFPFVVIRSEAFRGCSVWARALLFDIAEQYKGHNNGSLLCSRAYMLPLGWKSTDMLVKARNELLAARLLHQTVLGARPNKASWFALTWHLLDPNDKYDRDLAMTFQRGAYRIPVVNASAPPAAPAPAEKTRSLYRPTVQEAHV